MEPWIYKQINAAITQAPTGSSLCILGPSGVGKTHALKSITAARSSEWEVYWIDSTVCSNTKDMRDILDKQFNTSLIQKVTATSRKRIIIIDELETLHQLDRNLFSFLASIHKHHPNHVVVFVGSSTMDKKVSAACPGTQILFFGAFNESDICIILKERCPACSYTKILAAAEKCYGNIAHAIHMIEMDQYG
jgi:replication-associated recombination protein RarA